MSTIPVQLTPEPCTAIDPPAGDALVGVLDASEPVIEVEYADGTVTRFTASDEFATLQQAIAAGEVERTLPARVLPAQAALPEGVEPDLSWSTAEAVSAGNFKLRRMYQPIWAYTMKGLGIGTVVGIVLKMLDTTVSLFSIDERAGVMWLLVVGSLLVARWWWWAPLALMFFSWKAGIQVNFFITALAAAAVGSLFGAPLGMLVGTIVGTVRRGSFPEAPDHAPTPDHAHLWGFVVPAIFVGVAGWLYLFWFNPMVVEWLSE